MKRLVLICATLAVLASCSTCNRDDYMEAVGSIVEEWDDAVVLADQTPRMSLAPRISELQDIWREAEDAEIPECFVDAHGYLLLAMEYTIEGYLSFLSQDSEGHIQLQFQLAQQRLEDWGEAIDEAVGE